MREKEIQGWWKGGEKKRSQKKGLEKNTVKSDLLIEVKGRKEKRGLTIGGRRRQKS